MSIAVICYCSGEGFGRAITERYDAAEYNYRMTDLQATVGIVQLQRLDGMMTLSNFQSYMARSQSGAPIHEMS